MIDQSIDKVIRIRSSSQLDSARIIFVLRTQLLSQVMRSKLRPSASFVPYKKTAIVLQLMWDRSPTGAHLAPDPSELPNLHHDNRIAAKENTSPQNRVSDDVNVECLRQTNTISHTPNEIGQSLNALHTSSRHYRVSPQQQLNQIFVDLRPQLSFCQFC